MHIGFIVSTVLLANVAIAKIQTLAPDLVKPFTQPQATTSNTEIALKFQPILFIENGCQPYAAVNAAGDMNAGLQGSAPDTQCQGSKLGSQMYSRSRWYQPDMWAMMYAWYFPKDTPPHNVTNGVTHDWVSAVVWLNSPDPSQTNISVDSTLMGISVSIKGRTYQKYQPLSTNFTDKDRPKLKYFASSDDGGYHCIDVTTDTGAVRPPLIDWDQLTDEARNTLETGDFGTNQVPFKQANIDTYVQWAWEGDDNS